MDACYLFGVTTIPQSIHETYRGADIIELLKFTRQATKGYPHLPISVFPCHISTGTHKINQLGLGNINLHVWAIWAICKTHESHEVTHMPIYHTFY